MNSSLSDINVWVAVAHKAHLHHESARDWFHAQGPNQVWFCRFTQMGLLRLLTNKSVMQTAVMTQAQAWGVYDGFMRNARVRYMDEPFGVEEYFRQFTNRAKAVHGWSDAYLAAIALRSSKTVVTFDAGFAAYGVPAIILK